MSRALRTAISGAAFAAFAAQAAEPPADCEARVGYDRDRVMSGYILPTAAGARTCIPFSTVAAYPPPGYKGDFYVDEFSDARMREQWAACKAQKACFERVSKAIKARQPPNKEFNDKDPRHIYLLGKVAEGPEIDLKSVRRPAFFAADPWQESVAQVDQRTWIVEFTAPREPYERIHMKMTDPIKLRGWYIRGEGVDNGKQGKQRALVVMSGGGGTRTTAITDPRDRLYRIDATGKTHYIPVPSENSGASGQQFWRDKATLFNKAGFDVLLFDRRGVGISGGYSDTNTHQQGRDLLAIVASLRTGEGMRAMSPAGETRKGEAAALAVRGGRDDSLPVILFGNSRGTMATGWAMTKNFDKDCTLDLPEITCGPPVGDKTIKAAILFAEFTSGQGYVMDRPSVEDEERGLGRDRPLFIGGNEVENNLIFFPSSAILAGMDKWPAAFFARGLYDYAASLQGTVDSYRRVKGLKELVVVRGPHPFESWPAEERSRSQDRALAFALAVIQGKSRLDGGRPWTNMKELAATSSDVWEESTKPTTVP
jgi:pimeloyl-ACP methyl ester carboxylesterase